MHNTKSINKQITSLFCSGNYRHVKQLVYGQKYINQSQAKKLGQCVLI